MQVSGDGLERLVRKMVYCGIRSKALEIGRAMVQELMYRKETLELQILLH